MKSRLRLIISLLLITVVLFGTTPQKFIYSSRVPASFDKGRLERLDQVFNKLVEEGTIPHAVTFVAHRGRVVHHQAYGWKDVEAKIPCRKDDIFRMASQTKAITSVAVLMLFEEGKFLLDDPVKKYIPEFANPVVLTELNDADTSFTTRPARRDITIRHLLTHTSGITYGSGQTGKIYRKAEISAFPMLSNEKRTLADEIKALAVLPLDHDPGDRFTYGMNTDVLGYLIEVVSGMTVDRFFRERIFEPLQMNDTYFFLPENKQSRLVKLYEKSGSGPLRLNNREGGLYQNYLYEGAGTLFSTGAGLAGPIEDYAKFCQMILNKGEFNGKRILSRKTVEMMSRNAVGDLRGEIGFGLAFDDFRPQYAHRSMASVGSLRWGGMFGTDYLIDPQEELILLFYINLQPNQTGIDFKVLFHNLVYQALM